jgi:folate-binding protein YgfZ
VTSPELDIGYGHLRHDVGAYRLARDVVRLDGPAAAEYLQGQCSQDLSALALGTAIDTLVLAPDGKIDALARVIRIGQEVFHLDIDGGFGEALLARLARFKLRSKFTLELLDWDCVALRGPSVPDLTGLVAASIAPVEWNGWSGLDLLGPPGSVEVPESVPWCEASAWEAARIESGVPVMGRELTDGVIPAETGTVERAVSFTKGCFTGQELVARIDSRGAAVPHRLSGLVLEVDTDPERLLGVPLLGQDKDKALGRVTSAAWCPGLGAVGALAYVHRSMAVPGRIQIQVPGTDRASAPWAAARPLPLV